MKRLVYLLVATAILGLPGCDKDEEESLYYIYFAHQNPDAPSSSIEYPIFMLTSDTSEMDTVLFGSYPVYSGNGVRFDTAGEWMTFAEAAGVYSLAVQHTDGSDKFVHYDGAVDYMPNISEDGKRVVFVEFSPPNQYLCLIDTDSTDLVKFTPGEEDTVIQEWPSFSPDGQWIVYSQYSSQTRAYIYRMKVDGSDTLQLTEDEGIDNEPSYSPDGSKIIFVSNRSSSKQIYLMNTDGSEVTALTSEGVNYNPSFSLDGKKIAFVSERDGNSEIYIMDADGSNQKRLTFNTVEDIWPVFCTKKFL